MVSIVFAAKMAVTSTILLSVLTFALLSTFLFIYHELNTGKLHLSAGGSSKTPAVSPKSAVLGQRQQLQTQQKQQAKQKVGQLRSKVTNVSRTVDSELDVPETQDRDSEGLVVNDDAERKQVRENETDVHHVFEKHEAEVERKGSLVCNGTAIDSEVVYWRVVPGDDTYESPITPHHG